MKKLFLTIILTSIALLNYGQQTSGFLTWSRDLEKPAERCRTFKLPITSGNEYAPTENVICCGPHLISVNIDYSIIKNGNKILLKINHSNSEHNNVYYYEYNGSKTVRISDFGARVSIKNINGKANLIYNGKSHAISIFLDNGDQQDISNQCATLGVTKDITGLSISTDLDITEFDYNGTELVNAFKPYFMQNIFKAPVQQETEQKQDNNTNQNSNYSSNSNNSNNSNSNSQSQYEENTGSSTQYSNQNTTNQNPSNNYISQEEYNRNQKRLSEERYEAEKQRIYEEGMAEIDRINTENEQRQRLLDNGMTEFAAGIASGDRYERTGAVMRGAATTLTAMGVDPGYALAGTLAIGLISALSKTEEEKEAERMASENERLLNEFQVTVKIADKKLLLAEEEDEYDYHLYMASRKEYEKIISNKFAGSYPADMIYKIDYLIETERIKRLMFDYAKSYDIEPNKNYLSEFGDKIYFYFATIEIDPKNRVSYLKTSNVFPVYYNKQNATWPYLPEIKQRIHSKQKNVTIKGYFKTRKEALANMNADISKATRNYYKVTTDYYKFTYNNEQQANANNNTDFWGTENKDVAATTQQEIKTSSQTTDFWGNEVQPDTTSKAKQTDSVNIKKAPVSNQKVDFWGNPEKK